MADTFMRNTLESAYQIHGHRNIKALPIKTRERVFNLEGKVEFGGCLRCLQVDAQGEHAVEVKNEVFKAPEEKETVVQSSIADTIIALRNNKYILEKQFGNISSFNFTKQAFRERVWDTQTLKARGLYLDVKKGKVAARAYEKFFNINEQPETRLDALERCFKYPVIAYRKENGFLGLVSYDEYQDDFFIASKSTIESPSAKWLKEMLYEKVTWENIEKMKRFIKEEGVTFVFECVDMKNDPHIIAYPQNQLFLLDIVKNDIKFSKYDYEEMTAVADQFGLQAKKKAFVLENWQEFFDWYEMVLKEDYEFEGEKIEGFVLEDASGYMVKLKLAYYNFWKSMRAVAKDTLRIGYILNTAILTNAEANEFYGWLKGVYSLEEKDTLPQDICSLRKRFYEMKKT